LRQRGFDHRQPHLRAETWQLQPGQDFPEAHDAPLVMFEQEPFALGVQIAQELLRQFATAMLGTVDDAAATPTSRASAIKAAAAPVRTFERTRKTFVKTMWISFLNASMYHHDLGIL
jgi:hypothetical protein